MNLHRMLLVLLLLSLLPAFGLAAEKPSRKKLSPDAPAPLLLPLVFDQLITVNRTLTGHNSKVRVLAYAPDGSRLVSGDDDKTLIAWNLRSGEQIWSIKNLPDRVTNLSFCNNGETLALSTKGEDIHLVNSTTGAYITGFRAAKDIQSLACSSRGQMLAAAVDKSVVVWDLDKLRMPPADVPETKPESGGLFDWMKRKGGSKKTEDQARADKAVLKILQNGNNDLLSVAFSPNGIQLAAAGKGKQISVWDVRQWSVTKTLEGVEKESRSLVFSPDGGHLAAVEDKRKILLWDLYGKAGPHLLGTERDDIAGLAFTADGAILVSAGKKRTVLWGTRTLREIHVIPEEKREPLTVQCSPDNTGLAIAGEDKLIRLWNLPGIVSLTTAESSRSEALKALDHERDERIATLNMNKSEFESSREHTERLKRAKIEEKAIRDDFAARRKALAAQLADNESRQKGQFYPYVFRGELGSYDADQGQFHARLNGTSVTIKIPAQQAQELAGRRDKLVFSGMLRYHDPQHGEFLNGTLVDQTSGARFPFGKQVSGLSTPPEPFAPKSFDTTKRKALPNLEIVSVSLLEPSGNNALDAGEQGSIRVLLRNTGSGSADGVVISLRPEEGSPLPANLSLADRSPVGDIAPDQSRSVDVPISADEGLPGRELRLQVAALETGGFDAQPVMMAFSLKAMVPPALQVARIEISDAEGKRVIAKGKEANVTVFVKNAGSGPARGVKARIDSSDPQVKLFGDSEVDLGAIKPGETKRATFTIAVTQRYTGSNTLPVSFRINEERPRFGIKPQVQLALNKEAPEVRLVKVKEREAATVAADQDEIGMAPLFAVTRRAFSERDLAVVIGIERYQSVPKSDFAYNDARSVKSYLLSLGFAERNIEYLADERATLSAIRKSVESWLPNHVKPGTRIFFYYSGHGAPDPVSGDAYIVPFDGDPSYLNDTGYPIKRLYEKLGAAKAAEVIVVMDSCFSGSGGRSVMAKGARPLVLMSDAPVIPPQMAILASTQGSQISTSFEEKEHGVFTYYFLKAIKEGKGDIDAVYRYLKPLVEDTAKGQNVTQSPVLSTGKHESVGSFRLLVE